MSDKIPYKLKYKGFINECNTYTKLEQADLTKYLTYCNPRQFNSWKSTIIKTVDKILKVKQTTLYIEESLIDKPYIYHKTWFLNSRLPRLRPYPHNKTHLYVWLVTNTDNIRNLNQIKKIAQFFGVLMLTISELIQLVTTIANTVTTANANTANTLINYNYNKTIHIPNNNNSNKLSSNSQLNSKIPELDIKHDIEIYKKLGLFYGFDD